MSGRALRRMEPREAERRETEGRGGITVKDWNRRIIGRVCLVGAALAVLAVGTELSRERARVDAANLIANNGGRAAAPATESDGERDECAASAGFWGPDDNADGERGERRMVCKRYA